MVFIDGSGMARPVAMVQCHQSHTLSPPLQTKYLVFIPPINFEIINHSPFLRTILPTSSTYISATAYQTTTVLSTQSYPASLSAQHTHPPLPSHNMRPSPRLFQQATTRAPSALQRFANSPMSPPIEAYPLFVLITGMVSLACLLLFYSSSSLGGRRERAKTPPYNTSTYKGRG